MKVIDEQEFLYMVSKRGCNQSCLGTILELRKKASFFLQGQNILP